MRYLTGAVLYQSEFCSLQNLISYHNLAQQARKRVFLLEKGTYNSIIDRKGLVVEGITLERVCQILDFSKVHGIINLPADI